MSSSPQHLFLSYVESDKQDAAKFCILLAPFGISVSSSRTAPAGADIEKHVDSALSHCSVIVVLIGPKTRDSRWVDLEIALATAPRIGMPGAGLLGIILPEHPDFSNPYYEPDSIPIRLHDRVRWEYAIVRKWTDQAETIQDWLQDVDRRRRHFRSSVNYSVHEAISKYPWDDTADTPRPFLQSLLERE